MVDFLEFKNEVLQLFKDGIAFAKKTEYPVVVDNLEKTKELFENRELIVVTCGEIKRGKSSLLSAFLEEKGLFPINMNVATNTVTIVRYGEEEKIEVVFENQGNFESKFISRAEIPDYVTEQGNKNNDKNVNCLNIEIPNQKLKDGLVFVDTPGVGSLNFSHSEVTYGYLPNADIVLFVSDVLAPLTEPELKFLESAYKHCKNIIYPLTKIDKISNYDEIIAANMENISNRTGVPTNDITTVPVSSVAKLNYMETKNKMMLNHSRYNELEKIIWEMILDKKAEIMVLPFLLRFKEDLSLLENNLKIAFASLVEENKAGMKKLEEDFKNLQKEKQKLVSEGAEWKQQLNYELSELNSRVLNTIRERKFDIEEELETLISQSKMSSKRIEEIKNRVNDEILGLAFDVKKDISESTDDIIDRTYDQLGLSLNVNADISKIDIQTEDLSVKIRKEAKKSDTLIKYGRNVAIKASGAATLTGLAGGLIGGAFGFFVGGPAGAIVGAKGGVALGATLGGATGSVKGAIDGIRYLSDDQVRDINRQFARYSTRKITEIQNITTKMTKDLAILIQKEFSETIKYQLETLEKNISDINKNAQLSREDAEKKAKALRPQMDSLGGLQGQLKDLIINVEKMKETSKPNDENQAN